MVNLFIYEFSFVVIVIIFFIVVYFIRSTHFKKTTNRRLKTLFEISKLFYKTQSLKNIVDDSLKTIVDALPELSYVGLVLCEDEKIEYVNFYDILRGYKEVKLSRSFIGRLKESKVYFSIDEENKNLNYPELDVSAKIFPFFHVLKFYLDKNSYGAFIIGSDKSKIDEYEYEFLRIFVEHFAFGVRTQYLTTKVKHFTKTLNLLENTYQRIVDNLPVGVVGIKNDENYKVMFWNDLMEEMFDIDAEKIVDHSITDMFLVEDNKTLITELIEKTILSKEIQEISSMYYISKNGREKYFLVLCYLLRDYESGFDGSILVFRDITDNKLLEKKLRRAREIREEDMKRSIDDATKELQDANIELKRLNSMKSEFVSIVSHELRTPLTSIRGYASLLKSGKLGKLTTQQGESIGVIENEGKRLSNLINDILDLSKLQAGKVTLDLTEKNIVETVKDAVKPLKIQAEEKDINLKLTGLKDKSLYHDDEKMMRVFYNIIGNAIKFTGAGGSVNVSIKEKDEFILITIKDTGAGIPEDKLKHIFEPFSQVENSLQRHAPGTGLGLTISQHIVELHHGKIEVESRLKEGSSFKIYIPQALGAFKKK